MFCSAPLSNLAILKLLASRPPYPLKIHWGSGCQRAFVSGVDTYPCLPH